MLPGCGCEWCWCYPLRMRRVEIQISRRGHPIRASPKRLPNQHSTAPATLADHTDLRRRSTLYTTRHSTPIGAAKQPPYVVARPPLNSLGLSWSKIIRLCSAYLGLHYTITHTYNAGQCTHIYLESSNTPTALRRPRHGSGPSTPGPGSAWASPRERPPRSLAPALVPKEY